MEAVLHQSLQPTLEGVLGEADPLDLAKFYSESLRLLPVESFQDATVTSK